MLSYRRHPVEIIESDLQRPRSQLTVEIWAEQIVPSRRTGPTEPEVPFADASGEITRVVEQRSHRLAPLIDEQRIVGPDGPMTGPGPPAIATCHQVVSARRADGGRRVRGREAHAFARKPIDVRCLDLCRPITAEIAVTQIVGQNEDDVGF